MKVKSAGVELAVRETGPLQSPTVVLVHGYPDNQAIWDRIVPILAERLHVVTYDVRGAGESSRPRRTGDYAMDLLTADLRAVLDKVSPLRPVHLVGHDWGSVQNWGAITGGTLDGRIASFTSISGPCIEQYGQWVRDRIRRPTPRHLRQLFAQFARSWYLVFGAIPGLAQLGWRLGGARLFPVMVERMEGIERTTDPALLKDALYGMKLYRANALRFLRPGRPATIGVPVQIIVPTRDAFVSAELSRDLGAYAPGARRRELAVGHWGALRGEPEATAAWIAEFVDDIEAGGAQG